MRLYVNVKDLRLHIVAYIRRVKDSGYRFSASQVVDITRNFSKFHSRNFFSSFLVFDFRLLFEVVESVSDFRVLLGDVVEVSLPSVEVMLVLPDVIASKHFLDDSCDRVKIGQLHFILLKLLKLKESDSNFESLPHAFNSPDCALNSFIFGEDEVHSEVIFEC